MNNATYNQLRIFLAIVDAEGIRPAARKLEMAPPSVSKALQQLEQNMGLPLIIRTTRQMELTDAGQRLYDKASILLCSLGEAINEVRELHQVPSGKLRLTLPGFAFDYLIQPIYAEFCRAYPQIQLELSASDAIVNLIKEGFDAGIRGAHQVEQEMVSVQLTPPVKMALIASPEYLAEHGTPRTFEDLTQHQLIRYRYATSNQLFPLLLSDDNQEVRVDMTSCLIVNQGYMVVDAAKQGLGLGIAPYPMVKTELANGELVPLLEANWQSFPSLHLYFPQHSQKAKRIRVLVDFLKERAIQAW